MKFERIADPTVQSLELGSLVRAFSYALDLTEGQPPGHSIRSCWIGVHVGQALGLGPEALGELHHALLLKDLGCSSNAARICELYGADDRAFKQGFKTVGTSLAATLLFVTRASARGQGLQRRAATVGNILRNGVAIADEMILSRCTRGAEIAQTLRFSGVVQKAIYHLDEHWDGSGRPEGIAGDAIPLFARIALLAQVADVFHTHAGRQGAIDEVRRRAGTWLDPELVRAFLHVGRSESFWTHLACPMVEARLSVLVPESEQRPVDEDFLDSIARAFGQVIDAKSPYTANHSSRVGNLAVRLADAMDVPIEGRRELFRAALLHDVGKLGVSNAILDKPGSLDPREWEEMRGHAMHTLEILDRIGPLRDMARVAAAHHERLDGRGYPFGLAGEEIGRETRIITVCDFFDALTSDRPYRRAIEPDEALRIMSEGVGTAIDADCLDALRSIAA